MKSFYNSSSFGIFTQKKNGLRLMSQYHESFDLLFKNIINSYIGTLGSKVRKTGKFFITDNVQEAAYCCMKYNNFPYQTDGLYEVHDCTKEYKEDSYIPIFNHILDLEAIELHKMQQLLESFGGKTVYLNTDQVVAKFETNIQINKAKQAVKLQFWDKEETQPKYKFDNNIKHKEIIPSFVSYDEFALEKHEWQITPDCQHNDFKQFSNDLVQNIGSFCLNGRAGCGKSSLIRAIQENLTSNNKKFITLCPTNKACRVLQNAQTLHSFYMTISEHKNKDVYFNSLDYIMVDEISMVKEVFYRLMYHINNKYKHIKWVISGDFQQLSPVNDIRQFNYSESLILKQICKDNMVLLNKCRRADNTFFNDCKNVMNLDVTNYINKKATMKHLCYTNSLRKQLNDKCMRRYMSQNKYSLKYVTVEANEKNKKSQQTHVYTNLPLIGSITNKALGIINSDEYFVQKLTAPTVLIKEVHGDKVIEMFVYDVTKYFQPSYAISIHSSQGISIDKPYSIHQ